MTTVKRLQDEGLPVKALVVGNGTFEKYLSKLKHVCCLGWLSGNALGEAYASSDILLFPSDVETFGNVTLEALSSGCPSVVEKKCGEHLVETGVNGLTCPCGDFEAFYQATRRLVLDTQLRQQMGKAAREKAWKFERNIILQQMAENYKVWCALVLMRLNVSLLLCPQDAIEKHRDPMFLKKYLAKPEGAGVNLLSFFCCNYYFVKLVAEPFLNTSRGVQDLVDNTAECVSLSRSRLSCGEFMTSSGALSSLSAGAAHDDDSLESAQEGGSSKYDDKEKKGGGRRYTVLAAVTAFLCTPASYASVAKLINCVTILFSVGIVLLFIYASFTV